MYLSILPDGIQWLVGLIYEASQRKKLLDLTKGSSPLFWSFPSQTSNYRRWTPAAELSPLLLYQYPLDIFQEQSGKHFQQMLLMSLCLPRDADSCFRYHYEKASLFNQENKRWFFPESLISLAKQHLHSLACSEQKKILGAFFFKSTHHLTASDKTCCQTSVSPSPRWDWIDCVTGILGL